MRTFEELREYAGEVFCEDRINMLDQMKKYEHGLGSPLGWVEKKDEDLWEVLHIRCWRKRQLEGCE